MSVLLIIAHYFSKVKEMERNKMKICAIICEYNPFHNGHLYQLNEAKRRSGADAVLCIMSGNFVQRGEAAVVNKFTRAKHAVLGGADIVIELPTVFATSNAELFAKGAISVLSSIPAVKTLCFGAETADKNAFLKTAELLNNEPESVSLKIKELTANGIGYAKARATAWQGILETDLLSSPNNILGVEYTRAILSQKADIDILPIERIGGGYNDTGLQDGFSSASAIRAALHRGDEVEGTLLDYVKKDLSLKDFPHGLDALEKYALLARNESDIAQVCDCTEGLENAFKKAALQKDSLEDSLTSARYTAARIRRIALQNLLNIEEVLIRESLQSSLYLRVLAANKARTDVLSALGEANCPILARARDEENLNGVAQRAFAVDRFAEKVYGLLCSQTKPPTIFF